MEPKQKEFFLGFFPPGSTDNSKNIPQWHKLTLLIEQVKKKG